MWHADAQTQTADFHVILHSTIVTVDPLNDVARLHLQARVAEPLWFCGALVVEPRYLDELLLCLADEGFTFTGVN